MIRLGLTGLILGAAIAAAGPVTAQNAMPKAPQCSAAPAPLPAELSAWSEKAPAAAAADQAALANAVAVPGKAVALALKPTPDVKYALRPERPGGSVSFGGMLAFDVGAKGTYRIALGSGAWIDVVKDGQAAVSSAHGHGPDCSGIRKMVDFALEPGRYVLQIVGNGTPSVPVMVARLP